MCDTERVEIVECSSYLMGNDLSSVLGNGEFPLFKVGEEVSAGEVFHHDVDVVLVLKYIKESDDIRMLAHLKYLNFSSLQLHIAHSHLLLAHDLHSHQLPCLLVDG